MFKRDFKFFPKRLLNLFVANINVDDYTQKRLDDITAMVSHSGQTRLKLKIVKVEIVDDDFTKLCNLYIDEPSASNGEVMAYKTGVYSSTDTEFSLKRKYEHIAEVDDGVIFKQTRIHIIEEKNKTPVDKTPVDKKLYNEEIIEKLIKTDHSTIKILKKTISFNYKEDL